MTEELKQEVSEGEVQKCKPHSPERGIAVYVDEAIAPPLGQRGPVASENSWRETSTTWIFKRRTKKCISIVTAGIHFNHLLISTDANANALRIEGKEESTYCQCTGTKVVMGGLNLLKELQRFCFCLSW